MTPARGARKIGCIGQDGEQAQVHEIEVHGEISFYAPSPVRVRTAAGSAQFPA
ncbi:hypothetical protein P0D88_48275 [Paraburkholderia sp. RL18-103-BIB-C]|jgi:hypothetical protein|uniref:hypothetical protein n=1 Tax=unclassified Paraburkholderia TaxID=2615204 RepID=UPI0038BD040C